MLIHCRCQMTAAHMPRGYTIKSTRHHDKVHASISADAIWTSLPTSDDSTIYATQILSLFVGETTKSIWGVSADDYVVSMLMSIDSSACATEKCFQIYVFMAMSTLVSQWFHTPIFCRCSMVVAPMVRRYCHFRPCNS